MSAGGSCLSVKVPAGFDLPRAVCSYGYFLLAPNRWEPSQRALFRPLHGERDRLIGTFISQPSAQQVRITCDSRVSRAEAAHLRAQVTRMLRLDEDLSAWRQIHPQARSARFDRLFRSPTLFEDIVKTMTGCNVTWTNTMRMNTLLCDRVGQGGFPTPQQLARLSPSRLQARCKVGYRARWIILLARQVIHGQLDLDWFQAPQRTSDQLTAALRQIFGIGPYAAANLCQLLGRYDRLPIDTETVRHFRQTQGAGSSDAPKPRPEQIEARFSRFAPYQFLAYWFELWQSYQDRYGDARGWLAHVHGPNFTAATLRRTP